MTEKGRVLEQEIEQLRERVAIADARLSIVEQQRNEAMNRAAAAAADASRFWSEVQSLRAQLEEAREQLSEKPEKDEGDES